MSETTSEALRVRASIIGCKRCELAAKCTRPVPFDGPHPSDVCVIGEAPGREEDRWGKPFIGPSGQLAKSIVEPRLGEVAWLNVVCCFPNRTPTARERDACKVNLEDQLGLIRPRFLLVFGGIAAGAFVDGLRVGELRGRWFRTGVRGLDAGVDGLVTWHPAAVLRNRSLMIDVLDDVKVFRDGVEGAVPPYTYWPCVKCGSCVDPHVNEDGIVWCEKHWNWKIVGEKGKGKVKREKRDRMDGRLF